MTFTKRIRTMAAVVTLLAPMPLWAAQQPATQTVVAECARAQPQALGTIDAANMRLESARQENSPPAMRAAVDDLQGALRQLRAQLAACAGLETAAPADPHAGHAMPSMPRAPAAPAVPPVMKPGPTTPAPTAAAPYRAPAAADPHAGHTMPKPQTVPVAPGGKPAQKSRSAKPAPAAARPAAARDPHAGHDTSAPAAKEATRTKQAKVMDPVTGLMVDPTAAPKTTYQGQTYYFSSEQAREEFLQNPAKFVKKPKP